jgi:RHH-type rel operon transcriptional repressor/antitoxin RelB
MATIIELPPEDDQRLDVLVAKTGRSKEFYIRELVERGLEDVEDYYSAVEVMERVRQGKVNIYSSEEVRAKPGLDS